MQQIKNTNEWRSTMRNENERITVTEKANAP